MIVLTWKSLVINRKWEGTELGPWVEFMCDGRVGICEKQK